MRLRLRSTAAGAALALILSATATAQPAEQTPAAQIDALFAAFKSTTPGCAVGVGKNGSPVFSKGYGMADLEHGIPITPKTMFYMASVSKQFTALTMLMLAKENKLALTDSVRKYIPELPSYTDKITIYHLLTHTSGVRDYFTLGGLSGLQDETAYSEDIVLRMLSRQQGLNFEPGTSFLYSNSGYVLLSIIAKRVTGEPLNEVSRTHVFNPLGMTATLFQHDHSGLIENKAFGYDFRKGAWHASNSMLDVVGDGGLYSSVDDMFHWMGNFDAPKVGADSLSAMEVPATLGNGKTIEYGMGLSPSTYRGLKVVDHSGALAGYRTEDMWFPSERLSIVVLCNSGAANPVQLARKVSDLYLKDAPQPAPAPTAQAAPAALSDKPEVAVDPKLLDTYVGDYELRPGFIISFIRDKDHLVERATGQGAGPMYAVSNTAFRLRVPPAEVDFDSPAAGGNAQSAVIHQNGSTFPMKRVVIRRPSGDQAKAYEGKFYSAELDVTYEVSNRDGTLKVHYPAGDINLDPVGKDVFAAGPRIGTVKFVCADGGTCSALSIDDGRALNMRFVRAATTIARAKPGG
jgi:CubicO group peptidase (beta-lactamase class C family)